MKRPNTIRLLTTTVIAIVAVSGMLWLPRSIATAEPPALNAPAPSPSGDGALFAAVRSRAEAPAMYELPFPGRLPPAGR